MSTDENTCRPLAHGSPCWTSIPVHSVERARKFYTQVFNWGWYENTEAYPADRIAMVKFPDDRVQGLHMGAGLIKMEEGLDTFKYEKKGQQNVRPYYMVKDVDETLEKVKQAGGKVITPKEKEGQHGEMALVADTEGNAVGVYTVNM